LALTGFFAAQPPAYAIKKKASLEAEDHPEVVLITARHARTHETCRCAGVLLSERAVLTVAHGVDGFDRWEVSAPYAKNGTSKAGVKTARVYPGYKPGTPDNDLALLILDEPIDIAAKFPTLHEGNLLPIETKLLVVGRVDNGSLSHAQLFKASTALVPFPGNTTLYGGHPQIVEEGDSGGPVFTTENDHEIVGIVSGYLGLSRSNVRTDVYIPISSKNKSWILRQVSNDLPNRK
jgi:secreted trypsin-like serine protease